MGVIVKVYRFEPPGPSFDLTLNEKFNYPILYENTAKLNDYPDKHEMLGLEIKITHRLYEGHGTKLTKTFYNNDTDKELYSSVFIVPEPSTKGYEYWSWYINRPFIGHCSWEIDGPMRIRIEFKLESNTFDTIEGTGHMTVTFESEEPDACPSFWTNPIEHILCRIASAATGLRDWLLGTLFSAIGSTWDAIQNFFGDVYDFFADVIGSVVDIIKENVGSIFDWLSEQFFSFVDWIVEIGGDIAGFVGDKISGALDWVTDSLKGFGDWLEDVGGSIVDYVGGAIGDFVDWSADQLGGIWEGVSGFFMDCISGFIDAFFGGVETGIEEAKHSPLHSDEPVRNPVLEGLRKVVREHRKKYNEDEITGDWKNGRI